VAVYAENKSFAISKNRTATADVVFEHAQSVTICWQYPLATTFLLLSLSLLHFSSALRAKGVTSAESLSALGAGQLQAGFEMFDANCAMVEVYVLNRQSQGLADPATTPKQHVNEKPIS
jgi:phosphatidylglycerophosphate synthase